MKYAALPCRLGAALALVTALVSGPARADLVLLGSDYYETIQPTFATPLGSLAGLPVGPGTTDMIVRRKSDCAIDLHATGSNCTIPIEMVALSLVSVGNPSVRLRESPTLSSTGTMTIASDGSGNGGTFASFFDVFFELSSDGGQTWTPQFSPLQLAASNAIWAPVEHDLLVAGLVGDPNANRHTDKGGNACPVSGNGSCVDFYVGDGNGNFNSFFDVFAELSLDGGTTLTARSARVPEPGSLALLGLALAAMAGLRRRMKSSMSV